MKSDEIYYAKGSYKFYPIMTYMKPTHFLCTYREYPEGQVPSSAITVSLGFMAVTKEIVIPISGLKDIGVLMQQGITISEEIKSVNNMRGHLTAHIPPEEVIRMIEKLMIQKVG